ncbi:MAG: lysylphosphatidylglycerol synthase transmembrane domain-containing protein [Polyangiaceae bacterium]
MSRLVRRLVAVVLLGVVVYGGIVLYRGVGNVAQSLRGFGWWAFAAACGLAFTNYLLRFLKWEYYLAVLDIRGVPKGESLLTFLSGFVLTITPGKVGEVFKSLVLAQTRGVPLARSAPIVVAERVTDLIGVIALIAIGSIGFPGGAVWASAGALVVVALLAFVGSRGISDWSIGLLPRLPGFLGRAGGRIGPRLGEAMGGLRELTSPRRLVWPTLLSVGAWSLEGIGLWVILGGFGVRAPLPQTGFIYATATLAGALIPVPGGLGVVDKLLEEQMARLGQVDPAIATAAMLLVRFATLWFAVAVGFAALGLLRLLHPGLQPPDATPPTGAGGHSTPAPPASTPDARKDASFRR